MNRNRVLAAAVASVLGMITVGCQKTVEPGPFDPTKFSKGERDSAGQLATNVKPALPTTFPAITKPQGGWPPLTSGLPPAFDRLEGQTKMTLREAVQRAVANNLDVRVASYDPAIEGTRVVEAQAQFDPAFFTNLRYDKTDRATAGTPTGQLVPQFFFEQQADVWTAEAGLRQNLPTGGRAQLSYQSAYNDIEQSTNNLNPFWENNLQLEITQPLLRNMGLEVNQANITIAQNNQRISTLEFRNTLEEQLTNLEQTYWQLVSAVEEARIQQDLLLETTSTVRLLVERRGQDVSALQENQARVSEELRRTALVRARARVGDLSDQLKRLMNDPSYPVTGATLILPDTDPLQTPMAFKLEDQINAGMDNRLELAQQQLRINSAGVAADVAKNGLLPQLNLRGLVGFQGLDEDLGGAFDSQLDFSHFNWGIGLEFEIPIGNRAAKAVYQRSLLQRQQAIDGYHLQVEQISMEIKQAAREVETTWNEIATGRNSRWAGEAALKAIIDREKAGEALTPTFVQLKLDTQERLANARVTEAQAISNYNFALARLERAKGTLLKYDNVQMQEEPSPFGTPKKK